MTLRSSRSTLTRRSRPSIGSRLWRWSAVAEWYGIEDSRMREAGPTAKAVNGWLALREIVPELAPDPRTLIAVLTNAVRAIA
jgi:hypothetical protein